MTEEALNRALETQGLEHVLLGQFAVQEGYLKNEEAARILSVQKSSGKRVEKFGEVAMDLGFLTEEKLRELLSRKAP
ncbi:MAG: hypothetical protein HZA02_02510 [Nitrospinae bacterium]|nr:hypothetical protein [Nitrospinota bacterium]